MKKDKELTRHTSIMDKIKDAKSLEELPKFNLKSEICGYLANNVKTDYDQKARPKVFYDVYDKIIECGNVTDKKVKVALSNAIKGYFYWISIDEFVKMSTEVLTSKRIPYLLEEGEAYREKYFEFLQDELKNNHKDTMKQINSTFDVKALPKVGLGELNYRIKKAVNGNSFFTINKVEEIKALTDYFLGNNNHDTLESAISKVCSNYKDEMSKESFEKVQEEILAELMLDPTIEYMVEEMKRKEERKLEILKLDHEETMQNIKDAKRISQLPPNLTPANLNNYLKGNTTLYTKDDRITSQDLYPVTDLLLSGKSWDSNEIKEVLMSIVKLRYPEKADAYFLLRNKFKALPKTDYLVEEINYSLKRQEEFVVNQDSNVNVYFIPNDKSPIDGGKFYNCYINRTSNLDLESILPLDLDTIVPPQMDIDSIEWYVQEKVDPTFKVAGGIILARDETIGNVNVFKPNDGKVGVSLEEKQKMDEIDNLDNQLSEKKKELEELKAELESVRQENAETERLINSMFNVYEQQAIELQDNLINSIKSLKKNLLEESIKKRTRKNN